jgi:hypothetical protein
MPRLLHLANYFGAPGRAGAGGRLTGQRQRRREDQVVQARRQGGRLVADPAAAGVAGAAGLVGVGPSGAHGVHQGHRAGLGADLIAGVSACEGA